MMRRPAGSAHATGRGCGALQARPLQQRRQALRALLLAVSLLLAMMRWRRARTMTPGQADARQDPQQGAPRDRSDLVRASLLLPASNAPRCCRHLAWSWKAWPFCMV